MQLTKTALFFILLLVNTAHLSAAEKPLHGSLPIRIPLPGVQDNQCINPETDRLWLTLYRIVETKKSGFFSHENQAEIVVKVAVASDPQSSTSLAFPLSAKINTANYGSSGQVSLPVEYPLVNGLVLQQGTAEKRVTYTGLTLETTLLNVKSKAGLGSAIDALNSIVGSSKLPIPSNPYSQAAGFLFGFASTAIQNDIDSKNTDDKYPTATMAFSFTSGPCVGGLGAGFETTGTKAILMEEGDHSSAGYVPIDKTSDYCWAADTTPVFQIKAAKKIPGRSCSEASYHDLFRPIANDYIAYLFQKQTLSKTLGPAKGLAEEKAISQRMCAALNLTECPAAK